ncbi:hypothetical protein N7520_011809 [Penicillium odoratum]|uniref:uncharacterized protein n=1 Tax=Penicillium odoratum TaxID=1167516 RepID=UPI002549640E|nr:uncharacterized protein N7520_011809 [Penicillium odoratum]KAJ5746627.1 hypothetical protein N7520_011809 [Penicillium odoratum]
MDFSGPSYDFSVDDLSQLIEWNGTFYHTAGPSIQDAPGPQPSMSQSMRTAEVSHHVLWDSSIQTPYDFLTPTSAVCHIHNGSTGTSSSDARHGLSRSNLASSHSAVQFPTPDIDPRATYTTNEPSNTHDRRNDTKETTNHLKCKWENCLKPPFRSKGSLMRHIDTQHIAPLSFKCSACNRSYNRKDNLKDHQRRAH